MRIRVLGLLVMGWAAALAPLHAEERVEPAGGEEKLLPGVALSQGITEITGVAISPLLGVSGVGAWQYFHTSADLRDELPWYCQPWAWGTGLSLVALCFLKDALGATAPGILKKPFDMVELFENKASALVASAAFVPLVAREMAEPLERVELPAGMIGADLLAAIDPAWILVPGSVIAFLLVWLCSHAVNVLIILSPFSLVDSALKLSRAAVLSLVGLSYWIAPWLGAVLCVGIIALAAWFAPSALRLMIFGTRFAGDVLLPGRAKRKATPERPHVFTLGKVADLPPRTGGRLALGEHGEVEFCYRRFCLMPESRVALPAGPRQVAKGMLSPTVVSGRDKLLIFLPRYRGHEEGIAERLSLDGTREHAWNRGWSSARGWLAGVFGRAPRLEG